METDMAGDPTILHEDDDLRLSGSGPLLEGGQDTGAGLTVSFTGIGAGMDVVQAEEFRRTAGHGGRSVLFVADKSRSWYNSPGLYERILELTAKWRAAAGDDIVTLGNSMGGFGSLLFAAPMGARVALAFGPQVSISHRVIPQERRWAEFISAIAEIRFEDVNDALVDGPTYVVIHGSGGHDGHHIQAFKPRPNLRHYIVEEGRHSIAVSFREQRLLAPLIAAACQDDWAEFDRLARQGGALPLAEAGSVSEHMEARRAKRRAERAAGG
jgi:S-formylglutathione hydrolase FrmB